MFFVLVATIVPVLAGFLVALVLALWPLPGFSLGGAQTGWCGPGATSDNAIQVIMNPSVVAVPSPGESPPSAEDQAAWEDFCVGQAKHQLTVAGIAGLTGELAGGAVLGFYALSATVRMRPRA